MLSGAILMEVLCKEISLVVKLYAKCSAVIPLKINTIA